jgi:ectoine hydroxylase-related dioxygenase (phytanoyl-CoA dioxygenase family)
MTTTTTDRIGDRTQVELSDDQARFYNENGYLAPLRLLDDRQLQEMRHRLEMMIRDDYSRADELVSPPRVKAGEKPRMIYFQGAWRVDDMFRDLVFSPRLTMALCQLLSTDSVRFFHDQIFYKPARHGGIVAWHQDYSYWTRTTPAGHITCFMCLDDATLENGCLHVIPGSHKWNLLPKIDLIGGGAETMESIKSVLTPEQLEQFKPTPIFLKAGECSFHHCLTLHGSYPNQSDRPRRSIVLNYMKPDTRSASDQPIMPGAPSIPQGAIVEGELFPIAGRRHAR